MPVDVVGGRRVVRPLPPPAAADVVRAPDGMERRRTVAPTALTRAAVVERAKRAAVPQRVQIGPTCGLYALGMVMDFWHAKDAANPTALVQDRDLGGRGKQFTLEPTTSERILTVAKELGFTALGEMFTARQLAKTAEHFGYVATTHEDATLDDLYRVLDAGHPAIVAFDVDYNGDPADFGGDRAHYAIIQGYFDALDGRMLVARHGWGVQEDHVWSAERFDQSWKALHTTAFYGEPGDDIIPDHPGVDEPDRMALPDAGAGRAKIYDSLGTKIVEVVPPGASPVGGTRAA